MALRALQSASVTSDSPVFFALTKKARARNLLLAPPPFSSHAPDSPAPTRTPASANCDLDGPLLCPKPLHHQAPLRSLLFSIAFREATPAPPILNCNNVCCCCCCT